LDAHTLVHAISVASNKAYQSGNQAQASDFMAWLLHQLHIGMGGSRTARSGKKYYTSVIQLIFMGQVEIATVQKKREIVVEQEKEDDRLGSDNEDDHDVPQGQTTTQMEEIVTQTNFLQLTLDIPEKPLFKDEEGGLVIPQEPLVNILKKFDGMSFTDAISQSTKGPCKRRYRLKSLPNHLILCLGRFTKNKFTMEKNPTIVPFPVQNLDLTNYVFRDDDDQKSKSKGDSSAPPLPPTEMEIRNMSIQQLKALLRKYNRSDLFKTVVEKSELIQVCCDFISKSLPDLLSDKYDLVANITHDIPAEVGREGQSNPLEEGTYRCHVRDKASGTWYDLQDLHVKEIMPQLIGVSESYVLVFEKK
jgi:U4/U6.U5 tri-snRNP-associated protein 2